MNIQNSRDIGPPPLVLGSSSPSSSSSLESMVISVAGKGQECIAKLGATSLDPYQKKGVFEEKIRNKLNNFSGEDKYCLIEGLVSYLKNQELSAGAFKISSTIENLKLVLTQLVIDRRDAKKALAKYKTDDAVRLACSGLEKIFSHLNMGEVKIDGSSFSEILVNSSPYLADLKETLPRVIEELEEWDRKIFLTTMRCFYEISQHREKHQMGAANWAKMLAPAILSQEASVNHSSKSLSETEKGALNKVTVVLGSIIANYPTLFPEASDFIGTSRSGAPEKSAQVKVKKEEKKTETKSKAKDSDLETLGKEAARQPEMDERGKEEGIRTDSEVKEEKKEETTESKAAQGVERNYFEVSEEELRGLSAEVASLEELFKPASKEGKDKGTAESSTYKASGKKYRFSKGWSGLLEDVAIDMENISQREEKSTPLKAKPKVQGDKHVEIFLKKLLKEEAAQKKIAQLKGQLEEGIKKVTSEYIASSRFTVSEITSLANLVNNFNKLRARNDEKIIDELVALLKILEVLLQGFEEERVKRSKGISSILDEPLETSPHELEKGTVAKATGREAKEEVSNAPQKKAERAAKGDREELSKIERQPKKENGAEELPVICNTKITTEVPLSKVNRSHSPPFGISLKKELQKRLWLRLLLLQEPFFFRINYKSLTAIKHRQKNFLG